MSCDVMCRQYAALYLFILCLFFFFKQKTAYEMRISDWSSDVCSSDLLGPVGEPGIFGAPSGEPLGEIGAGLGEVAPVVEPAQFLQAVVVGLPWQVIERVPQEVHVAALVCGAGQHLADRRAQAGMIVGDDELGAMQAPVTQAQQEVLP